MDSRDQDDLNQFTQHLFAPLPDRYDRLADLLSMGQDGRWRRALLDHIVPDRPGLVLDVATGPAGIALQCADRTDARVVGLDLTMAMLRRAQATLTSREMERRISLVAGRGEQLPFPDASFDALTFSYLLRYVDDPRATLAELARVVRPGGAVASLEFLVPERRCWRYLWWLYTRAVLPVGGLLTGGRPWFEVGRFLGPSISNHYRRYSVAWTVEAWKDAGLVDVGVRRMSLGGGLVMWGRRSSG